MRLSILAPLALCGCVASHFHAAGPTPTSVYAANRECIWDYSRVPPPSPDVQIAESFGLLGVVVAQSMPEEQARHAYAQARYRQCMADHGWVSN